MIALGGRIAPHPSLQCRPSIDPRGCRGAGEAVSRVACGCVAQLGDVRTSCPIREWQIDRYRNEWINFRCFHAGTMAK